MLAADTSHFDRGLDRSEKKMGQFGSAVKLGALGAGAAIGVGLFRAAKLGFGEFEQGQLVAAQTAAVLKSTGGVANVTAGQVDNLATSLMKKSGVDDEAIKSGSNVLLTFTKIRNETGKGNAIFDQATKATLNLSVALGKDMQSSAILVGKALNDPIKGMSALGRAGVQLSEAQKESIKTMVAHGDTVGAQKVLLKELETQFGGSAAAAGQTFSGQMNVAKESLSNFAGEMVGKAMPHLTSFASTISTDVLPQIKNFVGGLSGNGGLKSALSVVSTFVTEVWWPAVKGVFSILKEAWAAVAQVFKDKEPEIKTLMTAMKDLLAGISVVLKEVVLPTLRFVFVEVLPRVLGASIEIIAAVVKSIRGIVNAFVDVKEWVQNHWGTISSIIEKSPMVLAFKALKGYIEAVVDGIRWLIDHIPDIPTPHVPGWLDPRNIGSEVGKVSSVSGVTNALWDEIALGQGMGLTMTSGLRPGDPGDHGKGKAIDMAGPASTMAAYAMDLFGRAGLKDVIYGGLNFWQDNGRMVGTWAGNEGLRKDHFSHVHASVFDKGGWLAPFSKTLAINNTRHWEPVGPPGAGTVVQHFHFTNAGVLGSEREVVGWLLAAFKRHERRGGGPAFGT